MAFHYIHFNWFFQILVAFNMPEVRVAAWSTKDMHRAILPLYSSALASHSKSDHDLNFILFPFNLHAIFFLH